MRLPSRIVVVALRQSIWHEGRMREEVGGQGPNNTSAIIGTRTQRTARVMDAHVDAPKRHFFDLRLTDIREEGRVLRFLNKGHRCWRIDERQRRNERALGHAPEM